MIVMFMLLTLYQLKEPISIIILSNIFKLAIKEQLKRLHYLFNDWCLKIILFFIYIPFWIFIKNT